MEGIAPKVRQSTLRERAAKHAATEVLESTTPSESRQSNWFNYTVLRLRPARGPTSRRAVGLREGPQGTILSQTFENARCSSGRACRKGRSSDRHSRIWYRSERCCRDWIWIDWNADAQSAAEGRSSGGRSVARRPVWCANFKVSRLSCSGSCSGRHPHRQCLRFGRGLTWAQSHRSPPSLK